MIIVTTQCMIPDDPPGKGDTITVGEVIASDQPDVRHRIEVEHLAGVSEWRVGPVNDFYVHMFSDYYAAVRDAIYETRKLAEAQEIAALARAQRARVERIRQRNEARRGQP